VCVCVFVHVMSSHLAARLALLLCVDVDGGRIHTRESVVPRIMSTRMIHIFFLKGHYFIHQF